MTVIYEKGNIELLICHFCVVGYLRRTRLVIPYLLIAPGNYLDYFDDGISIQEIHCAA